MSDILNIEIRKINTSEGGGLGAIILAMTACGKFQSVNEGCKSLIEEREAFVPNAEKVQKYAEKFKAYKALYGKIK